MNMQTFRNLESYFFLKNTLHKCLCLAMNVPFFPFFIVDTTERNIVKHGTHRRKVFLKIFDFSTEKTDLWLKYINKRKTIYERNNIMLFHI